MPVVTRMSLKPLWVVVFAAVATIAISMGIRQTFGLYLDPISRELGLGRETFALAMGLQNLMWGFTAPFVGAIADKYGAGRVVIGGAAIYGIGLVLMATSSNESSLLTSGLLLGIGVSGTGFTAVLGAVGRAAPPEKRSVSLALTAAGGSLGQFAALPYVHMLIGSLGWITSLFALAATAAIMVPVAWGLSGTPKAQSLTAEQTMREAFREALAHKGFLLLTAGFFVCGFQVIFVATHLPAFLADLSFEPWVATWALAIIGLGNVIGTYLWGKAGQIMEQRVALSWLYLGRTFIFLGFLYIPLTATTVLLLSGVLGLFWLGTIPLTSGLIATLFGPRWMSMLFGLTFFSHQIGSFLGAWLGGYFYDIYHSYEIMWWISIMLSLIAALFHWPIREVPVPRLQARSA